jgi:hypothetical protein
MASPFYAQKALRSVTVYGDVSMTKIYSALALFNERADRLKRSALAKRMKNPHYVLDYQRVMKREWISADGVTEDAVDAFVLNIRLLIQDQDGFSIRALADDVYCLDCVPLELRHRFSKQREIWNEHRNQQSIFRHFSEPRNFTNGELFDVLMYGGLAHANRDKVALFHALTKQGAYSSVVCASFLHSFRILLGGVQAIRDVNAELMEHLTC